MFDMRLSHERGLQHIMAGYSQNTRFHLQIIGTRNKLAFQIYL
jgi:hypothetical protein